MDWHREGARWPNRAASRFVRNGPHVWHLQDMGAGEVALLLHGAGGATHSWRDLMPALAGQLRVVAPDLPGQGFTRTADRRRAGLTETAQDLAALSAAEGWHPGVVVGHSAGAALALELGRRLDPPPRAVVGLNAALEPFPGPARFTFPALARLLSANPLTAAVASTAMGTATGAGQLIRSTGSVLDPRGLELYRMAISDRAHVDGALNMMARWDLVPLAAALPRIDVPVLLLAGDRDRAVPPAVSDRAARLLPRATAVRLPDLGHLAHEEAPDRVAALILRYLDELAAAA